MSRAWSGTFDITQSWTGTFDVAQAWDGTVGVYVRAFTGAYDDIDNIVGIWSMARRTLTSHTDNLVRLRRDSDNTEQDFGADSDGNLDTAAISTFLGANSGYVVTLYDQSGNGNDLTEATAARQPLYVASGQNSHPIMRFDGSDDRLLALNILSVEDIADASIMAVHQTAITGDDKRLYGFGSRQADVTNNIIHLNPATDASIRFDGAFIAGSLSHPTAWFVRTTIKSGTTYDDFFDGATNIDGVTQIDNGIVDDLYLGTTFNSVAGDIAEIVIADAAWSTAEREAAEAAANSFWQVY